MFLKVLLNDRHPSAKVPNLVKKLLFLSTIITSTSNRISSTTQKYLNKGKIISCADH